MDLLRRLGTMGFGLPAAIGASVGSQRDFKGRKPVWLIAGDGSFQMTSEELTTAFLDHAPVKIAIIKQLRVRHGAPVADSVLRAALLPDQPG